MSFVISIDASCINCDMCVPECPAEAITKGALHYEINIQDCVQCEDYYAAPTCIEVCPIGSVNKITLPMKS